MKELFIIWFITSIFVFLLFIRYGKQRYNESQYIIHNLKNKTCPNCGDKHIDIKNENNIYICSCKHCSSVFEYDTQELDAYPTVIYDRFV